MSANPHRPLLRYHGGKWRLAPFVLAHLPAHRVYVEPFGGAASVLLRKPRSYAEIYNDLDEEIVGLFEVLRDPDSAARLQELVALTPYSRVEFERSYAEASEPVERARRLLVRSWMAHGSSGLRKHRTGFRLGVGREFTTPAGDWHGFAAALPAIVERLRGVYIERRPAEQVIARHDAADTLFYCDPPYMFGTRSQKRIGNDLYHGYRHELDDAGHATLLAQLFELKGMVVLSGYASEAYDAALPGWLKATTQALADRAAARTEVLRINPAAAQRLQACDPVVAQGQLFAEDAA
ncbi:DNA adenine methylase [Methylobacterium brachiatum]|uniref:DNA adenine methylase n=1 Tax=Methylobacterium brachiatum TaxID=269660 RepID=UPI002449CB2A|nr:DNA adenine methylase [Methylobacterium brachiatum]MDH2313112.1 DNA adenine methylase [Methylobacterium brachiatum]